MFIKHGAGHISVDNDAIGGTTARFWAARPNSLRDSVASNPDAQWVWLSIGGNDGINELREGRPIEEIVEDIVNNTRLFVEPMIRQFPHIKIVQFGYDITNFDMSRTCTNMGGELFPDCNGNIACCNEEMYNLQLASDLTSGYFATHTSVDIRGTLQKASGTVPAPFPNVNYYSPNSVMNDCIHPNSVGFQAVFDQLWEVYFKNEVATMKA